MNDLENSKNLTEIINLERRFIGVSRLYGKNSINLLNNAHVAIIGLGGVGSWTAEALVRCGIGRLTLVDLDHIAESNFNRQIHATISTLGQNKVRAIADRIKSINPKCFLNCIEDFISSDNVGQILKDEYAAIIDCTDQTFAKISMILYTYKNHVPLLVCGGAGGKKNPLSLCLGDLSEVKHDRLLAKTRYILRKKYGFHKIFHKQSSVSCEKIIPKMGITTLWLNEQTTFPKFLEMSPGLSCAGYGSTITVTATMGFVAANFVLNLICSI